MRYVLPVNQILLSKLGATVPCASASTADLGRGADEAVRGFHGAARGIGEGRRETFPAQARNARTPPGQGVKA